MSNLPTVSIIIPVYNAASTIAICLDSIQRLNYPKNAFEVIVVDNGSNDGSDRIARNYDIKLLYETTIQSSYQARNAGIAKANGNLIAFTDSDCVVAADWLSNLVKYWDDHTIGCFAGEILSYEPNTMVEKFSDHYGILSQPGVLNHPYMPYTATANCAYRREVFDIIGLFNPYLYSGGDADISWRMQKETEFNIKFIPEAKIYHKHRVDIIGLYKQCKRYEYGQLLLHKVYPDLKLATIEERRAEVLRATYSVLRWLPGSILKFTTGKIDRLTLFYNFFIFITCLGTYRGRLSKLDDQ
ncbi:MAG: glycosyltransferase family 2 protein [Candidatus Dadabacteria bacterium]